MYKEYILLNECLQADIERSKALYRNVNDKVIKKHLKTYIDDLNVEISRNNDYISDLKNKIQSLNDNTLKEIAELKFFDGLSNETIALKTSYSLKSIQLKVNLIKKIIGVSKD